jgi:hypothetical protein
LGLVGIFIYTTNNDSNNSQKNENKQNMGRRAPEQIAQNAKKKAQTAKKQAHLLSTSGNPLHHGTLNEE